MPMHYNQLLPRNVRKWQPPCIHAMGSSAMYTANTLLLVSCLHLYALHTHTHTHISLWITPFLPIPLHYLTRTLPLDTSLRNRACMMMYPTLSATKTHKARIFFIAPSRTLHTPLLPIIHLQILYSLMILGK